MRPATEERLRELAPSSPASRYEVFALRHGTCTTSRSRCFLGHERRAEADAELRMDFYLWVLRNAERTVVIDTGFRSEAAERRGRTCVRSPAEALLRANVDAATVDEVVLTHLHYDHAGNLELFPNARISVHTRELDFWCSPLAARGEFAAFVEPADLDELRCAARAGRVSRIDHDALLAPGVLALWTGGHTPGQMVLIAHGRERPVVIASDAAHFYEELARDVPFAIYSDLPELYAGYDLLAELAGLGATVVPGHDPLVLERFPPLAGLPRELGALLG